MTSKELTSTQLVTTLASLCAILQVWQPPQLGVILSCRRLCNILHTMLPSSWHAKEQQVVLPLVISLLVIVNFSTVHEMWICRTAPHPFPLVAQGTVPKGQPPGTGPGALAWRAFSKSFWIWYLGLPCRCPHRQWGKNVTAKASWFNSVQIPTAFLDAESKGLV